MNCRRKREIYLQNVDEYRRVLNIGSAMSRRRFEGSSSKMIKYRDMKNIVSRAENSSQKNVAVIVECGKQGCSQVARLYIRPRVYTLFIIFQIDLTTYPL